MVESRLCKYAKNKEDDYQIYLVGVIPDQMVVEGPECIILGVATCLAGLTSAVSQGSLVNEQMVNVFSYTQGPQPSGWVADGSQTSLIPCMPTAKAAR